MADIALILLAAGAATRMGTPKQLLRFHGTPLICRAAQVALASACRPVVVVVGSLASEVRNVLGELPVEVVDNARWEEGVGTSIHAGVRAVSNSQAGAAILALADQPLVTAEMLDRLASVHRTTGKSVVASEYSGTVGVPALFARDIFPKLLALEPNKGCKGVILGHLDSAIKVPCPEAAVDIDTPADYERLCAPASSHNSAKE